MSRARRALITALSAAVVAAAPAVVSATPTSAGAGAGAPVTTTEAIALGQQAYLYGFPLLAFLRVRDTGTSVRCPDSTTGDAPVNSFANAAHFARPRDRTVVAPNVDTLYSIAHLDLGRGPVVLSHPAMGRRYFVFELLDPYTNVIGYVGTRTTGSAAGRFAISWTGHRALRIAGAGVIHSAYRRVWVVGRTLASGMTDQRRAQALMRQYRLTPPGGARHFAPGCRPGAPRVSRTPTGMAFLTALDRGLAENPPPARDRPLLTSLARIGVGPGRSVSSAHLSPTVLSALVATVKVTALALPTIAKSTLLRLAKHHHGWADPASDIGAYGTDYKFRAGVASIGLGANTRAEAVYPTALTDAQGAALTGHARYRIVFGPGQAPPARAFWSLTMYDAAGYLVANPVHRYSIGSSHPPLEREPDGSIVVALQRARPSEAHVNWLPTPRGRFRLTLRIYEPRHSVLDGAWQPPPVQPVGR